MTVLDARQCGFIVGPKRMASAGHGPLDGIHFAAKDVFAVKGQRTGAGNPTWLATHVEASENAEAVEILLGAGATLAGVTVTDELAFSLSGTNVHYGTPVNPADPRRIPGGSSSGSAVAVARRIVEVGLGTDTAGSIRVPSSYCGLFGLRPTWGRISVRGVIPLAPSFDTVGAMAYDASALELSMQALLKPQGGGTTMPRSLLLAEEYLDLVGQRERQGIVDGAKLIADRLRLGLDSAAVLDAETVEEVAEHFRAQQLFEVWESHGAWISRYRPTFGPGVAGRFELASRARRPAPGSLRRLRELLAARMGRAAGGRRIVVKPVTPTVAPLMDAPRSDFEGNRQDILRLTSLAGVWGAPELAVPYQVDGLPFGIGLLGSPGDDEMLLGMAAALGERGWREML